MQKLELPSDTELKAVKKASSALESDAKKLTGIWQQRFNRQLIR